MAQAQSLSDDLDENYALFILHALELGCVWALESAEGFALCPSVENEERDVLPMWSQPEFAELHAQDEWSAYKVVPISTEELLDEWLPGMHGDLALVGVNWNQEMEGLEVEPLDLLEDIDSAREE